MTSGTKAEPRTQAEKFVEAARELGCDESEELFIETVKKLAKAPPSPHPKPPSKRRKADDPKPGR